jgi:enoyl-CoA hydratase/carnithine racemase
VDPPSGRHAGAESHLREFLRLDHDTTLPRFDVLAALYRRRDGVTMTELSRMLLVSNGNATTVVDRLESDGYVRRTPSETDRRTVFVALTPPGVTLFERLAEEHEREIAPAVRRAVRGRSGPSDRDPQTYGRGGMTALAGLRPDHFLWHVENRVATIRLNRPERKNPLTFESYAELRDTFRKLPQASDVDVVVFASNGGNFCSGGDVHDIIGPLIGLPMKDLLAFTRMTGDLVKAMIACGKPVIAAVDGICVGAGAIIAMAADLRLATPEAKCAFLFTRVGLAGCDMGACAMLPRLIGQGRAAELLYTGRTMTAAEGAAWGFWNALHPADALEAEAQALAARLAAGPTFAHGITKTQLAQEWDMSLDQAIEAEAQAQAICMQTRDFERAYRAFVAREKPVFEGN